MKKYFKEFCLRGLLFGGFGPIIAGIVFACIQLSGVSIALTGVQTLIAILSTYLLAFIQAGASVFNQIESWSIGKSVGAHFGSIYLAYITCYLVNRWIPWRWEVIAIFTGAFALVYLAIWLTVYLIVKNTGKKLNAKLNKQ